MAHPDRRRGDEANELRRALHNDTSIGWRGWLKHIVCSVIIVAMYCIAVLSAASYVANNWPFI